MKTVNKDNVSDHFIEELNGIVAYIEKCKAVFNEDKLYLSYAHEHAIIMVYKAFETFVLRLMISCLNHNHAFFEEKWGIKLGKHINDDICEFLITKGGYFDFKGRGGLNKMINHTIGTNHNLGKVIKNNNYAPTIEKLCAIRNFAAHNSVQAKKEALEKFNLQRVGSAGSCLKVQGRFEDIVSKLKELAEEIKRTPME